MEIRIDEVSRARWDRFTRTAAFQQNWAYGDACAALGSKIARLEICSGRQTIAVAQTVHRKLLGCLHAVVCTRGPVWSKEANESDRVEGLATLRRALPGPRLQGFFATPDATDDEKRVLSAASMIRVMTPFTTAVLNLTRPVADLRCEMHQKWRNRLVRAEESDLRVGRADKHPRLYHWLLEAELAQQKSNRYRALSPALVPAWQASGGDVRVYTAHRGDEIVAAMLFLLHGESATYHIGWTDRTGKELNAHNLLLWHAMKKLPRSGIRFLDLGGLNTEDIPGIARFKLGTGAEVKSLCGTWFGR